MDALRKYWAGSGFQTGLIVKKKEKKEKKDVLRKSDRISMKIEKSRSYKLIITLNIIFLIKITLLTSTVMILSFNLAGLM